MFCLGKQPVLFAYDRFLYWLFKICFYLLLPALELLAPELREAPPPLLPLDIELPELLDVPIEEPVLLDGVEVLAAGVLREVDGVREVEVEGRVVDLVRSTPVLPPDCVLEVPTREPPLLTGRVAVPLSFVPPVREPTRDLLMSPVVPFVTRDEPVLETVPSEFLTRPFVPVVEVRPPTLELEALELDTRESRPVTIRPLLSLTMELLPTRDDVREL